MCGIAGRFNHLSGAPVEPTEVLQMARRLAHRGPDGEGVHVEADVGLSHRRLSIIDKAGGAQPMRLSSPSLWVTYNGEIYNYVEIRRELEAKGRTFATRSDTEVLLAAYAEWGPDFVTRCNGMFAFALWDVARGRLMLCRDRLGVKPLYLAETPDGIVFASEMKALSAVPSLDRSLHLGALSEYLALGYVVHPRSMLSRVRKLQPGTMLLVERGRPPVTRTYWAHQFTPDEGSHPARNEERLRELFDDAVRLRLRSDVPIGVLLSGGVDSTAIAATLARTREGGTEGIATFCVGVDVPGAATEFEPARRTAAALGTEHHEIRLDAKAHGDVLLEAAQLLDEPLAEPAIGQLLAVCRAARAHGPVLLSGEGSDETWMGYTPYRTMYALELARRVIPRPVQLGLARLARRPGVPQRIEKYANLLPQPLELRYLGLNDFDRSAKEQLLTDDVRAELRGRDPRASIIHLYDDTRGQHPIVRMAAVDVRAWLVDNSLARSDVMSMAASVELRLPFMDYRLVEHAARVPVHQKVSPFDQKIALKRALSDRIPEEVRNRRKLGFPTPLVELFRGPWGDQAADVLRSPSSLTAPLFDRRRVSTMIDEHRGARANWARTLFQLLVLEYWARRIEGEAAPTSWRGSPSAPPPALPRS